MSISSLLLSYLSIAIILALISYFLADKTLTLLRRMRLPLSLLTIIIYSFNVTGGMYNRLSGGSFAPGHLSSRGFTTKDDLLLWWNAIKNPRAWVDRSRSQVCPLRICQFI